MAIQFVIIAKPELFEATQIPDRYHEFFREIRSYSFPDKTNIASQPLVNVSKQMFIASMLEEVGDDFFGSRASLELKFFDRWWVMKRPVELQEAQLGICEDEPAVERLERLERPTREKILSLQPDDVRVELQKLLEYDDRPRGPEAGGLLHEATDYFKPFPKAEEVFGDDLESHSKYLLPLATVSLEHINPAWSGPIHFVQPIEPYDGVVGEDTPSHHGPLCAEN